MIADSAQTYYCGTKRTAERHMMIENGDQLHVDVAAIS